ncbi:MAG: helix-turn-helix domain-containing protein [Stappiaceae bacterium]
MGSLSNNDSSLDLRLAQNLKTLRKEQGWSLDDLAERSGISRATLSRLENADVSPTAAVLGKLCATHGLTLSRLMKLVEEDFSPHIPRDQQQLWVDPDTGFQRRTISPPGGTLAAEMLECMLPAGQRIKYDKPPRLGLEHHLYLLSGALTMTLGERTYTLKSGDCLRYQLEGPSTFETPAKLAVRYILTIV